MAVSRVVAGNKKKILSGENKLQAASLKMLLIDWYC